MRRRVTFSRNLTLSLSPALIDGSFSKLWIFLVAPLVGGAIGGAVNGLLRTPGPVLERIGEQPPGADEPAARGAR